jgi:sulfatase maturation enzyme AslB (radical SAM superfamily)
MSLDKKDYVCLQPFNFSEIFEHGTFMCCPDWLPVNLGVPNDIEANWNSDKAKEVRESIIDGSYKFCNEDRCPKLRGLKDGKSGGFITKKEFLDNREKYEQKTPESIKLNFDRSCNLKCPSCRLDFIAFKGEDRKKTEAMMKQVEDQLAQGLTHIECTGTGDPFFSVTFRKWMMRFDPKDYPKVESIHLHTNGTLWNPSNWERMEGMHPFVKSAEISIDAATKDTYENKTRIGGKWDDLIANLEYIATLPVLEKVVCSYVVQKDNYKEMPRFYDLIKNIFKDSGKQWTVQFTRVVNWGTFTEEEYKDVNVGDPEHPEYNELVDIFKTVGRNTHLSHNLILPEWRNLL